MNAVVPFDFICLLYFIFHLVAAIFIDAQSLLPAAWFPIWARKAVEDFVRDTGDPLVEDPEPWFQALVFCEMTVQVPFLVYAIFGYVGRKASVRTPAILYSVHVCTTMVPIIASLITPCIKGEEINYDLNQLLMAYVPFLVIPFLLGLRWSMSSRPPLTINPPASKAHKSA